MKTLTRLAAYLTIAVIAITCLLFFTPKTAHASEGTVELRSTTSNSYRCYVASIQMLNLNYNVLVTCRDLLYPAGEDIFTYMLWGTPIADDKAIKFGELGLGRAEFTIKKAFSNLFVTTEKNKKSKEPVGPVVMRGNVEKISFLEIKTTPTPVDEAAKADEDTATSPGLSRRDKLVQGLRRAGLVSLLALIAVFGLVFILTRNR